MTAKIFYTIGEVSELTRLPQSPIQHYIRIRKVTVSPDHYPNINPRYVKGDLVFTQKDMDELLRFIDKRRGESWEKWELRRIEEIGKKRQSHESKQAKRPDLFASYSIKPIISCHHSSAYSWPSLVRV